MGRIVDITEKLSFDKNPVIKVKDQEIEVQSDAETMLKIMGLFSEGKSEMQASAEVAGLLFSEKDKKKIQKLGLQMKDYLTLVETAMNIAMDTEEVSGE